MPLVRAPFQPAERNPCSREAARASRRNRSNACGQLQEPLHSASGFDAYYHWTFQGCIKCSNCIPFVGKCFFGELSGFRVHHGYGLLSCVQITAQFSSRPPSSRAFLVGYRKVYSVRGEADVVMSSVTASPLTARQGVQSLPFSKSQTGKGGRTA